ncbi:MAG: polyamine aminopropyltransferase [Alphaproteobacteria bacterium]
MSPILAETLHDGWTQSFEIDGDMIVDRKSAFQHVQIFDNRLVGRVLVLDGIIQLTERDEATYSEMLSHVPVCELGTVKRVMIVGGGDGAIAEELLKHKSIEQIDLVDIDGDVVDLCKKLLPNVHNGAFDDPRLTVHVADAFAFLEDENAADRYDLIIADRPDPVGPAAVLFETRFYDLVNRALTAQGVAVFQTGVPLFQGQELTDTVRQHAEVFAENGTYLVVTPTYMGGFMALTWASKTAGVRLGDRTRHDEVAARFAQGAIATEYYTPDLHFAAFDLPAFVQRLVDA